MRRCSCKCCLISRYCRKIVAEYFISISNITSKLVNSSYKHICRLAATATPAWPASRRPLTQARVNSAVQLPAVRATCAVCIRDVLPMTIYLYKSRRPLTQARVKRAVQLLAVRATCAVCDRDVFTYDNIFKQVSTTAHPGTCRHCCSTTDCESHLYMYIM